MNVENGERCELGLVDDLLVYRQIYEKRWRTSTANKVGNRRLLVTRTEVANVQRHRVNEASSGEVAAA